MLPPVFICDDFLDAGLLRAIRARALDNRAAFEPATIGRKDHDPQWRNSLQLPQKLGPLRSAFVERLERALPAICDGTGVPAFPVHHYGLQMAAHCDGGFYRRHIDTRSEEYRDAESDRMISAVFYFHEEPARFSGGELTVYPFIPGPEPHVVAPRGNRLVAFTSVAPHEVMPVSVPSGRFADSRLSINCWIHRGRA